MATDRRTFLQLLSSTALTAAFPSSIARALSIPANNRTGTINDVEHIVFMSRRIGPSITTSAPCWVAVGTIISDRPPHRSARALISACGSYLG